MSFNIVRKDITTMEVDAVVNAANIKLLEGGGVCGAIFKVAGSRQLQEACDELSPIDTGEAVITPGFNLPAKFIIHAAGPIYEISNKEESERLLRLTYTNALKLAVDNNIESIAFPLISSGIYGYPKDEALRIATSTVKEFLRHHDLDVTLVVYDKESFSISKKLLGEVESYISEHYIVDQQISKRKRALEVASKESYEDRLEASMENEVLTTFDVIEPIDNLIINLDETFSETLFRLIDAKGMNDVEVYKRANIDRKLFSKIRSNESYMPSKRTAIAFAIALELSIQETDDLLKRAGYALSHAVKFDVIIEYFIINEKYDIFEINEVLFSYDQPLLGG